jgi:hypothetical protein
MKVNFSSMYRASAAWAFAVIRRLRFRGGFAVGAIVLSLVLSLALSFTVQGCSPAVHETGLTWDGNPLRIAARLDHPTRDTLRAEGWEALVDHPPARILRVEPGEWGDSLRLLEFEDDVKAYTAFQQLSPDREAVAVGEAVCGDRVCFRRGRWIGALDAWSWKGGEWYAGHLALPDAPVPGNMPDVFGSLLHQDRFAGSERVLTGEFMGLPLKDAVYAMQVDCRGDTAWVYASPRVKTDFAESLARQPGWDLDTVRGLWQGVEVRSMLPDLPPVILRFSRRGMVGVEGCFDKELTSYWLKMQARGLKNLK